MTVAEPYLSRRKQWIKDLRSGKYTQTDGGLIWRGQDDEVDGELGGEIVQKYCCLGVACVTAKAAGLPLEIVWSEPVSHYNVSAFATVGVVADPHLRYTLGSTESASFLPGAVQAWLGFERSDPQVYTGDIPNSTGDIRTTLSALNDQGYTFEQIADVIEQQLL